jgi:hypothetical protein
MKTLIYKGKEMVLTIGAYPDKTLGLSLTELTTSEPWATITICPNFPVPYGIAVIKNYSENEGIWNWLQENSPIMLFLKKSSIFALTKSKQKIGCREILVRLSVR